MGIRYLFGKKVGQDVFGNTYYVNGQNHSCWINQRRWVKYNGLAEPSKIPPLWFGWLHRTCQYPPAETAGYSWEKKHLPNLTGTIFANFFRLPFFREKRYESWLGEQVASIKRMK